MCVNLSIGEPDFCVPVHGLNGDWPAVREDRTHYVPTNEVAELREALAQKHIEIADSTMTRAVRF